MTKPSWKERLGTSAPLTWHFHADWWSLGPSRRSKADAIDMSHETIARVAVVEDVHEPCLLANPVHGVGDRGEGRAAWGKGGER